MKQDAASWEKLLLVLEWILDVKLRYADHLHFSLIYLNLGDREVLGNEYGAPAAHRMLLELARNLRLAMRKSDIVARNNTDFWLLLSHVQPDLVVPRISRIVEVAADNGFDIVDRDVSIYAFQDHSFLKKNGLYAPSVFLDHWKNNRTALQSWSAQPHFGEEEMALPPADALRIVEDQARCS